MKRMMQTFMIAALALAGHAARADQPTFPQTIDDNPGKAMSSSYADRHLTGAQLGVRDVFPASIDDNPGAPMALTYADRHVNDGRAAVANVFPMSVDDNPGVPMGRSYASNRKDRLANSAD